MSNPMRPFEYLRLRTSDRVCRAPIDPEVQKRHDKIAMELMKRMAEQRQPK